ncbi:hypothetical protein FIBSPDRAFT_143139 [Athelia psychrophila]|uniref:F-box domain-containing protein n=1 Tax=Athelia psychrophila TaxID=1759441 RepID=A0A166T1Q0_9AGAM|nr:hypothetical protein FIBSPDRAFT_143139 [Fibularhizoctonia sp. CBS 109695]
MTSHSSHIMICSECRRTLPGDTDPSTFPHTSPVPHLLTTNDPPNKHEADTTLDALARSRADLRILDGKIAEAEKRLLRLLEKRASVQHFVDEHAGLHLRRLPEEIFAMIFILTLPDEAYASPLHPDLAPVALGQVCRSWRAFSRAMPLLWTTIRI